MSPKTLLIGLDGATFTVLDPLMQSGVMPFLRDFSASGARAPLRSVMPPLTPPAWTSLITGKKPGQHGVFDFFQKEAANSRQFHLTTSNHIRSATVWSLAAERGLRSLVLNYPVTFPAPALDGCVVPGGWMPWRQLRLGCHPAGLFERLKSLPSFDPRELSLDMTLEEKAIDGCRVEEYSDWVALHIRREQRWRDIALYLMREDRFDLVTLVFDGVDKLQHLCWRFIDPACRPAQPSPWEDEMREQCERYFRQLDGIIEELVSLAGPEATVIFASDHGFGPASEVFYANAWLEQQGYLRWLDKPLVEPEHEDRLGLGQFARHLLDIDWQRTVAYAATPSSQGIHIVSGAHDRAYEHLQMEIMEGLREMRHPISGARVVAEVWTREEAFAGPYAELAPDISLILEGGAALSILPAETTIRQRQTVGGSHRWQGVFIAAGPGIAPGTTYDELSILDVAPVLLRSLGIPQPLDVAGHVPEGMLQDAPRIPVLSLSQTGPNVSWQETPVSLAPEEEVVILDRLRALGYVE